MATYLLYESPSGYTLFERVKSEEIGTGEEVVAESITDLARFSKICKYKAFLPFNSAENALENQNAVSEGEMTSTLRNFLEQSLPKKGKGDSLRLGVIDSKLANSISEQLGIKCESNEAVIEFMRGIRLHFTRFIKALKPGDLAQAQLGLGHSYSRSKVKFNVHRVDNMIIQSISLLDQLDKDLNTFSMRVREWYGWHFPELVRIVNDNALYCQLATLIGDKAKLGPALLPKLTAVVQDEAKAKEIIEAAKMSMGQDISQIDLANIEQFASNVFELTQYRARLHAYLIRKMNQCAPNLSALIGEQVGARLISHAGSLTSLAKYPASTVQILGAEKALFRSLKTKGNTPKYGLIFHSSFIGKATPKNKGRIARYLANKCSIASRIDSFSDVPTDQFGTKLRGQVEERLEFYKTGKAPRKNIQVMKEAIAAAAESEGKPEESKAEDKAGKKKKRKADEALATENMDTAEDAPKAKKQKKDKPAEPVAAAAPAETDKEKKKKEKKAKKDKKKAE